MKDFLRSTQKIQAYNILSCLQISFWMAKKPMFVHNMLWTCIFQGIQWTNLLSYCGLTDARMRASEKDLLVINSLLNAKRKINGNTVSNFVLNLKLRTPQPILPKCKAPLPFGHYFFSLLGFVFSGSPWNT